MMKERKGLFNSTVLMIAILGMLFMFVQTSAAYPTVDNGGCKECHSKGDVHVHQDFLSCSDCHASVPDTPVTSKCTVCHPRGDMGSEQLQTFHIEKYGDTVPVDSCYPCHESTPADNDSDGDGIEDNTDNCPDDFNAEQLDADNDGIGDVCDDCSDVDDDTVCDVDDNCPSTSNPNQEDADSDGIGDACDDCLDGDDDGVCDDVDNYDDDGDGVTNENDECLDSPVGERVDPTNGCSIEQLVPCEGPKDTTGSWRNHRKYMLASSKELRKFVRQGLITKDEKDDIIKERVDSSCGR